jgi:5'-nucleotidase
MHILLTNDDGVYAQGLLALAQELRKIGRVSIVAPDRNWSASGHVKTLSRPLRIKEVTLSDGSKAIACDGAPSDCVAISYMGLLDEPIEMVVSGINPNANLGHDITYSGTVTAAMEAAIWNMPGVAVSLDAPEYHSGPLDYSVAAQVGARVAEVAWKKKLPKNILLNVNVPYCSIEKLNGYCITRQGLRVYHDELVRRKDPQGRPYYWIGGAAPTGIPEDGTDIGALARCCVSVTPLSLDLTAYDCKEEMSGWNFN